MNDREFDALLASAAPELPPDDVARDVTPWRRAIGNILGGSAMCSITLSFFCLNYLLPTIGVILQLLGFRPLRRENRWFRACWLLAVLRAALFLPCIVLNATIYSNAVYASSVGTATRTMPQPASSSRRHCATTASTFSVGTLHMD